MKTIKFAQACLFVLLLSFSVSALAEGDGRVHYDLGVFALDEDNFVAAENYFAEALQREPDNPYYHYFLGKTYLKTKRPEDAIMALEAAWKLNPDISGLQFDLAMAYYEAGRYARAEELFSDLVAQDPTIVMARYYLGMAHFKQDNYGLALDPLLRAGEENESIRDNSYYFAGISHYKSDEPDKALEKLHYVESQGVSEKLRQSARQWQEVIRSQQARSARYNLYLKLGLEYDNNVRLDPLNADLFADEGDYATTAYFSARYKFVNALNRKVGIGYSHYQTLYRELSEFDLIASVVSLFYQERLSRELYLSLQYHPSIYWLDDNRYLRRQQMRSTLLYRLDDTKGIWFSYDFTDNDYYTDMGRNGQSHDFSVDFFSMLFNKKADLSLGAGYGHHGSRHPDYEYDLLRTHFEFSYALPLEWKLILKGNWDRKDFDNIDSVNNLQRQDDKFSAGLELSRPLSYKWLLVQCEYRYTRNDSNIGYYSYEKNVTGLSLIAKF